jgi:hypothetical protein
VITITNGTAESVIDIQGAPAVPSGDTNPSDAWSLTQAAPSATSVNTYEEGPGTGSLALPLTTGPQCDKAIQNCLPGAVLLPKASKTESLYIVAPGSSSSSASKFTTTVTWTALAP